MTIPPAVVRIPGIRNPPNRLDWSGLLRPYWPSTMKTSTYPGMAIGSTSAQSIQRRPGKS
jgi:hypothetical protein